MFRENRSAPSFGVEREDETLEPEETTALRIGIADLAAPVPSEDFNGRVLAAWNTNRDFASWPQQVVARFLWMLPTALLGFVIAYAAAYFQMLPTVSAARPLPVVSAAPGAMPRGKVDADTTFFGFSRRGRGE